MEAQQNRQHEDLIKPEVARMKLAALELQERTVTYEREVETPLTHLPLILAAWFCHLHLQGPSFFP